MRRPRFTNIVFATLALAAGASPARAQTPDLTPDPNAWRAVVYADLQLPSVPNQPFAAMWADKIAANNAAYRAAGDTRFGPVNAPVTESHFVIRSSVKVVVLSILNTATGCKVIAHDEPGNATLKRCPMRVAIYQTAGTNSVNDAGEGCFVEYGLPSANVTIDMKRNAAYAAYDVSTHTIRLGAILGKQAIDQCVLKVPLAQTQ